jgi:hypothetical protein
LAVADAVPALPPLPPLPPVMLAVPLAPLPPLPPLPPLAVAELVPSPLPLATALALPPVPPLPPLAPGEPPGVPAVPGVPLTLIVAPKAAWIDAASSSIDPTPTVRRSDEERTREDVDERAGVRRVTMGLME